MKIIRQMGRNVLHVHPPEHIYLWSVNTTLNNFILEIGHYQIYGISAHMLVLPAKPTARLSYGSNLQHIKSLTLYITSIEEFSISELVVEVCEYFNPRSYSGYEYKGWAVVNGVTNSIAGP